MTLHWPGPVQPVSMLMLLLACSDQTRFISAAPAAQEAEEQMTRSQLGDDPEIQDDTDPPLQGRDPGRPARSADERPVQPASQTLPMPASAFVAPRGACELAARVGAFSVEAQADFGVVQGSVSAGVVPTAIPGLALQVDTCRLLQRRHLSCLPACVGAETCGEDGACFPYPAQLSVGDVSIQGLSKATSMSPLPPGNSYFSPGADNPPFSSLSQIELSASGAGELEAFQLFGVGSEPLAVEPSWNIEAGTDLALEWPTASADAGTNVLIELNIDQHGTSPLSLACEFDDTGSAVVPRELVDRLMLAGVSGFPSGRITRRTVDHVDLAIGCVELVVGSTRSASISIAGYTPCRRQADCPMSLACNLALQRCE